jgi:quercetin dioxygenase-like cupin family protein
MVRLGALALIAIVVALPAAAETPVRLTPAQVAALPTQGAVAGTSGLRGVRTTVMNGDPHRPGVYTIRLFVPPHMTIQAHTHRDERAAVVVSGVWWFGYGPKAQAGALRRLPPGSFYTEPAGQPHFARTGDAPAVVYITGVGPTDTVYVAPLHTEAAHGRHDH